MMVIKNPTRPFGAWTAAYVFIGGRYRATIQQNNGRHSLVVHKVLTKKPLPASLQRLAGRSWETHDEARRAVKRAYESSPWEDERGEPVIGNTRGTVLHKSQTIPAAATVGATPDYPYTEGEL